MCGRTRDTGRRGAAHAQSGRRRAANLRGLRSPAGIITDRDIVVKCLAAEHGPNATTAGELAQGSTYQVEADASIEEMLNVMEENRVRRLPVIDNHRLVGIVSEA
jgi:CBS domain-containing protein